MTGLQEYHLDIKLVHTIKGHGIFQLVAKDVNAKEEEKEIRGPEKDIEMYNNERGSPSTDINAQQIDVCQYIKNGTVPSHLSTQQKRAF